MKPVHETNATVSIPRTDAFMEKFNARMKFLLGDNVQLDTDYYGWESLDHNRYDGSCRVVRYDGCYIYVYEKGKQSIALLFGDAADYKGRIIADRQFGCYNIPKMQESVRRYMEKNGVERYTSEIGYKALWIKMAPRSLIQRMVEVYELGLELISED